MTFEEWMDRSEKTAEQLRILAGIAKDTLGSIKRLESIAVAQNDRIERLEDPH
jgi:hypothetical protein